jgi:hypothetical protein
MFDENGRRRGGRAVDAGGGARSFRHAECGRRLLVVESERKRARSRAVSPGQVPRRQAGEAGDGKLEDVFSQMGEAKAGDAPC